MQHLTPVGLSKDGKQLVLVSASGEEYAVTADARLRAALRHEDARHGPLEMKMDSALRPRDIQARIRAGETPEDVATAAQTTVDGIMAFAGPVLAERAHVAQTAQRASVRRRSGEAGARTLGETSELFFAEHRLHDEDVEWDAWRRPDGRWALVATYAVQGSPARAEFSFDLPGRYVVADNDDARFLTGELRPQGAAAGTSAPARRLSTVRPEHELPLGDDAIELVRDRDDTDPTDPTDATDPNDAADLAGQPEASGDVADREALAVDPAAATDQDLEATQPVDRPAAEADDAAAAGRAPAAPYGMDPLPFDPSADTADADWLVAEDTALVERPGAAARGAEQETGPETGPDAGPGAGHPTPAAADPVDGTDTDEPALPLDPPPVKAPEPAPESKDSKESKAESRRKGRSSVPSWDEIMFGGGKSE